MGAQANSYKLVKKEEFPDTVGEKEVRKMVANIALEYSKGDYAKTPASYLEAVTRAFKNQNALSIRKDEPLSEGKLATLYLIDKAYDEFVVLVDFLKWIGEYRFELKRYANDMDAVFKQYHKLRDKNSFIDPVFFSDSMDIYEEMYAEKVYALKKSIYESLSEDGILSNNYRKMTSSILMIDGFIMCAEFNRDYISDHLSMSFICSFKIFEFIDFKKAKAASRRAINTINRRNGTDIQYSDKVSEEFQKICKELLLDQDIVERIKSMQNETGN